MKSIKNQAVPITRLTNDNGFYFFGYYDLAAFDAGGKFHLYHRVGFMDRQPTREDSAEIGMINVETKEKKIIAETTAWNFQEGAMLQWNPAAPDREVVYNIRVGDNYRGVVKDIKTGKERLLEMPVATLDPKGRYALSVNFPRLFDFRPGYGYHGVEDVYKNCAAPVDDGVFRIDMATGTSRIILSLQQIQSILKNTRSVVKNGKVVINQITCNTDGSRFVFILGSFGQQADIWSFALLSANADGSEAYVLSDHFCSSHYHWRDENHLLIFQWRSYSSQVTNSGNDEGAGLYLLRDKTQEHELIDPECGFFRVDGHCSYSPDRSQILYDSYPENNYQHLYVYDIHGRKGRRLASLYAMPVSDQDIRCDLHPRWNPQGKIISFDSTHENRRHIYLAQIG